MSIEFGYVVNFLYSTIRSYKDCHIEPGIHYVHGTPRDRRDMIFPEEVYNPSRLNRIADHFDQVCIGGHVHINGIYRRISNLEWEYVPPQPDTCYELGYSDKTIVTLGSVGQPRDSDPRATFATIDENAITFHRIEYDIDRTTHKILSNPNIDDMYGERLEYGRKPDNSLDENE